MGAIPHHPVLDIGDYRKIKLWQRDDGGYEVRWWPRGGPCTQKQRCPATADLDEAQTYYAEFCRQVRAAIKAGPVAPARLNIDQLCARWIEWAERQGRHKGNRRILTAIRRLLGVYQKDDLVQNPAILEDYHGNRGAVGDWTVARELGALRTVLKWAVDRKLITGELPNFKRVIPAPGLSRDKYLDQDQEAWFWDQALASGGKVGLFIAIAMETAARREAIIDLTWDRIDLKIGLINFVRPGMRKTKKHRPDGQPISDRLRPVLEAAWQQAPKDPSGKAVGRVIALSPEGLGKAFRKFTTAIGADWVTPVTPHVLRHTWASLAAMAGVPMIDIAKFLCDSVTTVEKHYAKLSPQHMRDVANFKKRPGLRVVA